MSNAGQWKTTADRRAPTAAHGKGVAHRELATANVTCAFCCGKGRDPFELMSPLSTCQVCGGQGRRRLLLPTTQCAFCRGTGVYPFTRMTCTACVGIGAVHVPNDAVTCPHCVGSGRASDYNWPDSPLYCGFCHGQGVVSAALAALAKDRS